MKWNIPFFSTKNIQQLSGLLCNIQFCSGKLGIIFLLCLLTTDGRPTQSSVRTLYSTFQSSSVSYRLINQKSANIDHTIHVMSDQVRRRHLGDWYHLLVPELRVSPPQRTRPWLPRKPHLLTTVSFLREPSQPSLREGVVTESEQKLMWSWSSKYYTL